MMQNIIITLMVCMATLSAAVVGADFIPYPMKARHWMIGKGRRGARPKALDDASSTVSTGFFEVARPVDMPSESKLICTAPLIRSFLFKDTGESDPSTSQFAPCTTEPFDRVVLRWRGTCSSRQFARISTLWMSGIELLRTSTPEFANEGGSWSVDKDVTRFTCLFKTVRKVALQLNNVLDVDYSGFFNISVYLDFYQTGTKRKYASPDLSVAPSHRIKAISLPNPKDGGYWFHLGGDNPQTISKEVVGIPRNPYRATIEICLSAHNDEESWYTNPPTDYANANNLTFGNGPFREVTVSIDGTFVGSVWPFPLVLPGSFDPMAWRPVLPIGTATLPSYDLDITPFVSLINDGNPHTITLTVVNSLSEWLVDANLHLWVDSKVGATRAGLISYNAPDFTPLDNSKFSGPNGDFYLSASRKYSFAGWVEDSKGNYTVCVSSLLTYSNALIMQGDYGYQSSDLTIAAQNQVLRYNDTLLIATYKTSSSFPFQIKCNQSDAANDSVNLNCAIAHGMTSDEFAIFEKGSFATSLNNTQLTSGQLTINSDNTVSGATGSLHQDYVYTGTSGCYQRAVSTSNSAIVQDSFSTVCKPCRD
ncbi:hypothetical protein KP509_38G011800 [Ceratopteris richardii]|uniref:Peptide N-acetyl-beta-D-glucosaminyl asparaginase amidase A N-terminal domain-containing protein n=1 Tax=Ceratopteris richardii TaxID=49495 RepID=A0A8T2Q2J1_CERRI|nr:hypothetical protein KP509_38G011800 [Ceratopteris richardii]